LGHLEIQLRGIWEIDPHGLEEHLRRFRSSFAVRSGTFAARSSFHWANWPNPPVSSRAIARSSRYARAGSRSAQTTVILREAAAKIGQPATFRIASAFLHATLLCEETVSWALNEERESDGV
jgi:hypothetical protein